MKIKSIAFLSLIFLFSLKNAQAQSVLMGKVTDATTGEGMIQARIMLYTYPDSVYYKGFATDVEGRFKAEDIKKGKYYFQINYIGYDLQSKIIEIVNDTHKLRVKLSENTNELEGVTILGETPPVVLKGDTSEYSASSYKVNKDANADDLVNKMPGVTQQDGKIQVQGEDVQKVLVDGKPFFGDDPNAALKNLPAEVIQKIQVFDQQSNQSAFTGVSDGNTSKTINIITKPNMKAGAFGKVFGGYGNDGRYKAGGTWNKMNGNERITILAQSNNINEQNFSADDISGAIGSSGGGRGRGGRGGSSGGFGNSNSNFLVNNQNGISTTNAFGINYVNQFGKNISFSGSYFFNNSENNNNQKVFRSYVSNSDTAQTYDENTFSKSTNTNHKFNAMVNFKIDSMNSIIVTPRLSYQINNGTNKVQANNYRGLDLINQTQNNYVADVDAYNLGTSVLFQHKFKKQGRTFSVDVNGTSNKNSGTTTLDAQTFYAEQGFDSTTNQQSNTNYKTNGITTNARYTEPISKKSLIQLSYNNNYTVSNNRKYTYRNILAENTLDSVLSNEFQNKYNSNSAGLSYRFNTEKLNASIGADYQNAELNNENLFSNRPDINRTFINVLPSAFIRYDIDSINKLRVFYRTNTNAPSAEQLQEVVDNTNPLVLTTGNTLLKQDYQHSLFMRFSHNNLKNKTSYFTYLGARFSNQYIAKSTVIANNDTTVWGANLSRGSQISRSVNLDGYMNLRAFFNYTLPVNYLKSNLNLNVGGNYTRTPALFNEKINYANSPNVSLGVVLSSNISDKIDFTISQNTSYSNVKNTLNTSLNTNYVNYTNKAKLNWEWLPTYFVNTEITQQIYTGLSSGFNQNYTLWNLSLAKKFLKNDAGDLRITVYDLLKQNRAVSRTFTDTYTEDATNNVLQRYYMLTFTYTFRNFKEKKDL